MEPRNRLRRPGNRLLGSLKDLQILALERYFIHYRNRPFLSQYLNSISRPRPFNPRKNEQHGAPNGTKFSAQATLKVYIVSVLVIYSKCFLSVPCHFYSQSRQSAKLFPQSSELGLPQPLTRRRVCPPLVPGGGAHSLAREGVGEFQFRRGDLHCGTLYL
jgi:hypothetical protein